MWLLGGGGTLVSIVAANSHLLVAPYTNGAQNAIPYRQAAREELRREGFNARSDSMKSFIQSISNSGQLPQTLEISGTKRATFSNSMPYYGSWQHFYDVNDAEIGRMQVTVRFDSQQRVNEVLVTFYVQTGYISGDGIRWPTMVSYTYDRDGNLKAFD